MVMNMRKPKKINKFQFDVSLFSKTPIVFWVSLVYVSTLILQSLNQPMVTKSIIFTGLMGLHVLLYWFSTNFPKNRYWHYFFVQGALIFVSAFLIPKGSPVILIGLLPILIAQGITILKSYTKVGLMFGLLYGLFCVAIGINYGLADLPLLIPVLFIILTIIIFYTVLYNRQVNEKKRIGYFLRELEQAHQKVEELILSNERQRLARDLHDTLAQGLAGLIMQLEAVDAHLQKGNEHRAHEIIGRSMQQARKTLSEARTAIDDLRSTTLPDFNFTSAVHKRINEFTSNHSVDVSKDIESISKISGLAIEHTLKILGEALANVEKHAHAKHLSIKIHQHHNQLHMTIEDDGVGFSTKQIEKSNGKYGLLGMKERVRLLGGKIKINSTPGNGTKLMIIVPM